MKVLAVGIAKDFKTWSVQVEEDTDPTAISSTLYEDKENGGVVPTMILLVSVEEGVPVVKKTLDAGDYN